MDPVDRSGRSQTTRKSRDIQRRPKLLAKRHTQKLEGKKLPENLCTKTVTFGELCDDALVHSQSENSEKQTYELRLRINQLLAEFGSRPVESIKKSDIVGWPAVQSEARDWAASSQNRWQTTFSLIFRVGIDNEKIDRSPAARIRRKTEGGGRVRFLSEAEEVRLRAAIGRRFKELLPHFLLSIHTGMRMSEQYGLDGSQIDFERRQIHLLKTKNGDPRTVPLNSVAVAALNEPCWRQDREIDAGLPFREEWRNSSGITGLVPQRARRSED